MIICYFFVTAASVVVAHVSPRDRGAVARKDRTYTNTLPRAVFVFFFRVSAVCEVLGLQDLASPGDHRLVLEICARDRRHRNHLGGFPRPRQKGRGKGEMEAFLGRGYSTVCARGCEQPRLMFCFFVVGRVGGRSAGRRGHQYAPASHDSNLNSPGCCFFLLLGWAFGWKEEPPIRSRIPRT